MSKNKTKKKPSHISASFNHLNKHRALVQLSRFRTQLKACAFCGRGIRIYGIIYSGGEHASAVDFCDNPGIFLRDCVITVILLEDNRS